MTDSSQLRQEIAQVQSLRDDNNMSFAKIAELMGFSERTAQRRYKAAILADVVEEVSGEAELEDFPSVQDLDITVTGPFLPDHRSDIVRFQPLEREAEDVIVICDLHIPLYDPVLMNKMIETAQFYNIRKLIIAGDYWNMEAFSSYLPHQPEAALDVERYQGNLVMQTLLETFDEVDMIWGNHDFRLSRKLGFKKSFNECMEWMLSSLSEDQWSKLRISELDYMYLFSGDRKYRICHPRNFSSVPLTVGRKLAQKHNCSVITAHSHHFALGAAPNGRDIVIEGGGFYDKHRTEYIQKSTNHHEWVQGFTVFEGGIPNLFGPILGNVGSEVTVNG